ncbi:MAG: hypothetical protein Q9181_001370 [Wetmoreana brouardii]
MLATPIASFVIQPRTNASELSPQINITAPWLALEKAGASNARTPGLVLPTHIHHTLNQTTPSNKSPPSNYSSPLTASWCRIKNTGFDILYSSHGGQPLSRGDIMLSIGHVREALAEMIKDEGGTSHIISRIVETSVRRVSFTLFDEALNEKPLWELHDALDVLLVCAYDKVWKREIHGTIFETEKQKRFASVAIRKKKVERKDEGKRAVVED